MSLINAAYYTVIHYLQQKAVSFQMGATFSWNWLFLEFMNVNATFSQPRLWIAFGEAQHICAVLPETVECLNVKIFFSEYTHYVNCHHKVT